MKKHLSKIITLALILTISSVLVQARSLNTSLVTTFEVDFDFQIGNSQYSKGKYLIRRDSQTVLILENVKESETKVILGTPQARSSFIDPKGTLTFYRYGNKYFLRKISLPVMTAKIGLSKDEKKVRRNTKEKLAEVNVDEDN
jgi:hypothetical protein